MESSERGTQSIVKDNTEIAPPGLGGALRWLPVSAIPLV